MSLQTKKAILKFNLIAIGLIILFVVFKTTNSKNTDVLSAVPQVKEPIKKISQLIARTPASQKPIHKTGLAQMNCKNMTEDNELTVNANRLSLRGATCRTKKTLNAKIKNNTNNTESMVFISKDKRTYKSDYIYLSPGNNKLVWQEGSWEKSFTVHSH